MVCVNLYVRESTTGLLYSVIDNNNSWYLVIRQKRYHLYVV